MMNGLEGTSLDIRRAGLDIRERLVILECGSNDGSETLSFLSRWPDARVFCFEPEPRAISEWKSRVKDERATLFEFALGREDGESKFYRSSGVCPFFDHEGPWNKSGSIRIPTGHKKIWPWVKFEEESVVRTRSLDSWSRENGVTHVDLIWADVQGAEEDLILGGMETLSRTKYLYTEVYDVPIYEGQVGLDGILSHLPGWRVLRRFPTDVLLANESLVRP